MYKRQLYHRIGYLITSGTSLHKIFALSKDKKKSEFNESLDELIKKSVAISGNYAELSYEKSLDYKRISTLLLLFNIESVRRSDGYGVYRNDDDSLTDTVTISQNEAGIDTEDRIIKLKKYIANMK